MEEKEIINRVANSKLVPIDLEDYYTEGKRISFNIKDWLHQGLVLREKEFRQKTNSHNWEQYRNSFVALTCTTDAIIPTWAFMLIATHLEPYVKKVVIGDLDILESSIYQDIINTLDVSAFVDKSIIIKGCTNKPVSINAYVMLINKLKSIAKSIMFGEACSSVPLYKRK